MVASQSLYNSRSNAMIYIIWWYLTNLNLMNWQEDGRKSSPHTALPWCDSLYPYILWNHGFHRQLLWTQTHPARGRQFLGGNRFMGEDAISCHFDTSLALGHTPKTVALEGKIQRQTRWKILWNFHDCLQHKGPPRKKKKATYSRVDGKLKIKKNSIRKASY